MTSLRSASRDHMSYSNVLEVRGYKLQKQSWWWRRCGQNTGKCGSSETESQTEKGDLELSEAYPFWNSQNSKCHHPGQLLLRGQNHSGAFPKGQGITCGETGYQYDKGHHEVEEQRPSVQSPECQCDRKTNTKPILGPEWWEKQGSSWGHLL